jgi:hypothetical protein
LTYICADPDSIYYSMARANTAPLEKMDANLLQKMKAEVTFYREDDGGGIRPRNAWVSFGADLYNNHLDVAARVALALSEVCRDSGQGKVGRPLDI